MTSEQLKEELIGALARGYCTEENKTKVVDPTLIKAMATEVTPIVAKLREENEELKRKTNFTYCAYCGKEYPLDTDGLLISEHIKTCDKHPLVQRISFLEDALKRAEGVSVEDIKIICNRELLHPDLFDDLKIDPLDMKARQVFIATASIISKAVHALLTTRKGSER